METKDLKTALLTFARQRPGFEFANYGDVTAYRADQRKATRQLRDARAIAAAIPDSMPSSYLLNELRSGNRLSLEDGRLDYAAGQYYCLDSARPSHGPSQAPYGPSGRKMWALDKRIRYASGPARPSAVVFNRGILISD